MYPKIVIALIAATLFAGLAVGCAGGQGERRSQGNIESDSGKEQSGRIQREQKSEGTTQEGSMKRVERAPNRETIEGVVARVDSSVNVFWLKPRDRDIMRFIYKPDTVKVTLGNEEVKPEDIGRGQRATVTFVVVQAVQKDVDRNIARLVRLDP